MSLAVGSFLTEQSVEEYEHHRDLPAARSLPGSFMMFFSYLGAGLIPIIPYVSFAMPISLFLSISAAIVSLVLLGAINAVVSHTPYSKQMLRMGILGGSVTIAGVIIGSIFKSV